MNRATAQKHLAMLTAFANGQTIQYLSAINSKWVDIENPAWDVNSVYRVKPEETFVFILYAGNTRWLSLYDVTETKANSVLAQERSVFPDKSFRMDKFKKVEGEQAK